MALELEREVLQKLAQEGKLTAANVVEEARDPESPLHRHFTWDDTEAARLMREQQARMLITRVKVTILPAPEAEPIEVRAFMSVPSDRHKGNGYRETLVVAQTPNLRAELLDEMLRRIEYWQRQVTVLGLAELESALLAFEEAVETARAAETSDQPSAIAA